VHNSLQEFLMFSQSLNNLSAHHEVVEAAEVADIAVIAVAAEVAVVASSELGIRA
jgi:hypothetical protein